MGDNEIFVFSDECRNSQFVYSSDFGQRSERFGGLVQTRPALYNT